MAAPGASSWGAGQAGIAADPSAVAARADEHPASLAVPARRSAACAPAARAAAAVRRACLVWSGAGAADTRGVQRPARLAAEAAQTNVQPASLVWAVAQQAAAPSSAATRRAVSRGPAAAPAALASRVPRCVDESSAVPPAVVPVVRAAAGVEARRRRVVPRLVPRRPAPLRRLVLVQPREVARRGPARAQAALRLPERAVVALRRRLLQEAARRPGRPVRPRARRASPSSPDVVVRAPARLASSAPPSSVRWPSSRRPSAAPVFPRTCRRRAAKCRAAVRCARRTSVRPPLRPCSMRSSAQYRGRASTTRALPDWWSRAARRPCRSGLLPIDFLNSLAVRSLRIPRVPRRRCLRSWRTRSACRGRARPSAPARLPPPMRRTALPLPCASLLRS